MDHQERRRRLAWKHRLVPAARTDDDIVGIADDLVALHSSDPASVHLSVCARMASPSIAAVEAALYDTRELIRHHAMRRTMWVMSRSMTACAHAACTRKVASSERKRSIRFVDGDEAWLDEAIDRIAELLEQEGPLTAREVGTRLADLARPITLASGTRNEARTTGHSRALLQAAMEGRVVRGRPAGSWVGTQYAWAAADSWCPLDLDAHDELSGAVCLVGAWLERFGPGTITDLVWWTGSTKTLVRGALERLATEMVDLGTEEAFVLADDTEPMPDPGPWVAVIPGLDPTAMGWKRRGWYLDDAAARRVIDRNGNIGPTIWADGRIVGGWAQRPDGTIATELTEALPAAHRGLLDAEVDRLRAVVGESRFKARFPAPNQDDLLASVPGV